MSKFKRKLKINDETVECVYLSWIAYDYLKNAHKQSKLSKNIDRKNIISNLKKFFRYKRDGHSTKYVINNYPSLIITKVNGGPQNYFVLNDHHFSNFGKKMYAYYEMRNDSESYKKFNIETYSTFYKDLGINLNAF